MGGPPDGNKDQKDQDKDVLPRLQVHMILIYRNKNQSGNLLHQQESAKRNEEVQM